tara:strand:- start:488 stop:643 length:156 start_codon:yes stop_codon:yes gene_type:complete
VNDIVPDFADFLIHAFFWTLLALLVRGGVLQQPNLFKVGVELLLNAIVVSA